MTPNEQQLLEQFLQRVNAAQGVAQDPQAHSLIAQRLGQQPDATYLLVQRAMLLEQALNNASQQIQQLQQQVQSQSAGSSFLQQGLDTRFGRNPEQAPTPVPDSYSEPARYAPAAAPQPTGWRQRLFGAAPAAPTQAQAMPSASAGNGWLGSAASTAAGVAGGMFLFNGLENLLGSHHGGMGGIGSGLMGQTPAVENITENVYLDDPSRSTLAQDAGANRVQDTDWNSSDDSGSFLDDDSSWDA